MEVGMDRRRMTVCDVERKWNIPGTRLCGESLEGFFLLSVFHLKENIYIHDISASRCI